MYYIQKQVSITRREANLTDGVSVELKGFDELDQKLQKLLGIIKDDKTRSQILRPGGEVLQSLSQEKAPYKTGNLKNSGYTIELENGDVETGFEADYGIHQEIGTSKMQGKHFVQRSIDEGKDKIQSAVSNALKKQIEKLL
jgi:HK97 gp10 family phage protein